MQKQIEELLNGYTIRTQAIVNRYTAEVQGTLQKYQHSGIDEKILQKIGNMHARNIKNIKDSANSAGNALTGAAINAAFEIAFFNTTKESAKTI